MIKNLQSLNIDWDSLGEKIRDIEAGSWFHRVWNWFMGFFD